MLEIKDIKKDYELKDETVNALKGINLSFRRSEFVAILGPSGCGKTTLLNIVGGLDRFSSGDLVINGVSTKAFKDKDWDNYRNHKVGFVFQSYNLIPHQTVLENVELALTLSGIKKKERKQRAIEVLHKVGLGDKLKSKPNQLSGGQMQRVAIARALVNDPEIILADEPTGALDSKTSVQIMELLKQVSEERLVIMVTHNPELAQIYANRTIKILDGEVVDDSNPYSIKEEKQEVEKHKKQELKQSKKFTKIERKKSMSLFTALSLSFKNLLTKKGRTTLVAVAGSIGIIGIALILGVSTGLTSYISNLQSESLSSYPCAVSPITLNMDSLSSLNKDKIEIEKDEIVVYDMLDTLKDYGKYNYISADFVDYITDYYSKKENKDKINAIKFSYQTDMHFLTKLKKSTLAYVSAQTASLIEGDDVYFTMVDSLTHSALSGTASSAMFEELDNLDYVLSMYDVIGNYPQNKNEVAYVVNNSSVTSTAFLGYGVDLPQAMDSKINLNDFIGKKYKLLLNDEYYDSTNKVNDLYSSSKLVENQSALQNVFNSQNENTLDLTVTCVLKLKDNLAGSIYTNGIMYTKELGNFYRENCKNSQIVNNIKNTFKINNNGMENISKSLSDYNLSNYSVNISELSMLGDMGYGVTAGAYNYSSINGIKQALILYFDMRLTDEQLLDLYLQTYGASDTPSNICVYVNSFSGKDEFFDLIDKWNGRDGVFKIYVNDSASIITTMLNNLVNIISYVLIAFAGISLVVSSLMIAIITYTSVIERTKEIGVLRSVGASKRDISRVFNAETIIIGLMAGLIGVGVSLILTLVIKTVLKSLTGIAGLAQLNALPCLILILISVMLTLLAGLVPAKIASKKDPVKALRSE